MAASKKDLINFEGSSAPFVQGGEGRGVWGRGVCVGGGLGGGGETDPWTD